MLTSTQNSSYRLLKQSLSLPSIIPPVVCASEFLKHYEKLTKTHSSAMRAIRLEHLKRVRIKSIEESAFTKVIRRLEDIATQPKFRKEYIDLQPLKSSTGFLEENENQFFLIQLNGYESPLQIDIRRDKGAITCYFSYKSVKPGPKIYDFTFKTRTFLIHSKFSFFKERKAYLCVVPDTDTNVTVAVSFGPQRACNEEEDRLMAPRVSGVYTFDSSDDEMHELVGRGTLVFDCTNVRKETKLKEISEVLSQSVDYISANKVVRARSRSKIRDKNHTRQLLAKQRRLCLQTESEHKASNLIDRKARRQVAFEQAEFINSVLTRKVRFEKMWISLVAFANHSLMLHMKFSTYKIAALKMIQRSIACQRFQKMYRKKFGEEFEVEDRMMALARNHLKLALHESQYYLSSSINTKLFQCLRESLSQSFISLSILHIYSRIVTIQRNWRNKKHLEQFYFHHLYSLWDKIATDEEERMKKGKTKMGRRFIHVTESQKMECVLAVFQEVKRKHREHHIGKERRIAPLVMFLPKYAGLRKELLRKAKELRRASRISVQRVNIE